MMSAAWRRLLHALNAAVFLVLAAGLVVAAIDELNAPPSPVNEPGPIDDYRDVRPGNGRVFLLFIDSLRPGSATDPALMPHLAGMRTGAVSGVVDTVRDAVTVPAIRAAFTGHTGFHVLGFVENFLRRVDDTPSLFTQLHQAGRKVAAYSDHKTFYQFGSTIIDHQSFEAGDGDDVERQTRQALAAFERFRQGRDDLVIYHLGYADYVAHKYGIHHELYKERHRSVDELIARIDAAMTPEETLVVMGDHGHTETGRHALGLDVPTYFLARGPGFTPGYDLGRMPITTYRYLLSWPLHVPLDPGYMGYKPAAALATTGALPPRWIATNGGSRLPSDSSASSSTKLPPYLALASALGLAFGVWILIGERLRVAPPAFSMRRALSTLGLSTLGGLLLFGLGVLHTDLRQIVHEPQYPRLYTIWGAALLGMLIVTRWIPASVVACMTLGLPLILLLPTTYRYGFPSVFAPAWFCWAVLAMVATRRDRPGILLGFGVIWLVQMFFFVDASNFEFTNFIPLSPEIAPVAPLAKLLAGLVCAWLIVYRKSAGPRAAAFCALFPAYVLAVHQQMLSEGSIASLVVAASTGAAAIWAFKSRSAPQWLRALATPLATTALFALFFYMARISADMRLNAVFLVAAVRLSILLVSRLPAATKAKPYHSLFLMIVALVFTGWVALKWGTTELEWQAVYDFFPPQMVENQVAWFLPLILLKYCLPIVVVRLLLAEARSSGLLAPIPKRELAWFVGAKAVSLALIALGLAYVDATSMVYLEAVQQLGIFLTLAAGLI